jgi:hypothetical protein
MRFRGKWRKTGILGEPYPLDGIGGGARNVAATPSGTCRQRTANYVIQAGAYLGLAILTSPGLAAVRGMGQHGHSSSPPAHASAPHASAPHPSSVHPSQQGGPNHSNGHPPTQHLPEFIQKNQGLSPQEQQRRLRQEPGFSQLSQEQQRKVQETLNRVNQMPPDQRQRNLERNENMERLPPQRQQQIRASATRMTQMPPDRQQMVKDAIRNLRNVPPGLRQSQLNSPQYSHLSPEERGVVGDLLAIEPYHPPPPPPR